MIVFTLYICQYVSHFESVKSVIMNRVSFELWKMKGELHKQLHLIVIAYLILSQMADCQYYIKLVFLIKLKLIKLIEV